MVVSSVDTSIQASAMKNARLTLHLKLKKKKIWSVLAAKTQLVSYVMLMNLRFAKDVHLAFTFLKIDV